LLHYEPLMSSTEDSAATEAAPLVSVTRRPTKVTKYGNMHYFGSCCGTPIVFGPNVGTMLCTYAMVLVPCVCFYVFILPGSDIIMWVAGSIVPVGITLSMLGATATDPGVLEAGVNAVGEDGDVSHGTFNTNMEKAKKCVTCKLWQPAGTVHCKTCGVCIAGHDHHCVWMGKCVGRDNLGYFHAFLTMVVIAPAFMLITCLMKYGPNFGGHIRGATRGH